jgi:hypothetical protein
MSAHAESEMVFECQARPFLESLPKQVLVRLVLVSNPHLSFEQFEMLRWYGYRLMELDREAQVDALYESERACRLAGDDDEADRILRRIRRLDAEGRRQRKAAERPTPMTTAEGSQR